MILKTPQAIIPDKDIKIYPTSGVYFHGDLENSLGIDFVDAFDCDYIETKIGDTIVRKAKLKEGIYNIEVMNADPNRKCTAFIWKINNPSLNFGYPWMGLIIYDDDYKEYLYALSQYNFKSMAI